MNIRIPNRYTRAQILSYVARVLAVIIFIGTIVLFLGLQGVLGHIGEESLFGDTINRITSDKADLVAVIVINIFSYLSLTTGLYLSTTLYITANTLDSTINIEENLAIIKTLLKSQVGDKADSIEIGVLDELQTSGFSVNVVRVALAGVGIMAVLLIGGYIASFLIPVEPEAPAFVIPQDCKVGDRNDSDCDGISNAEEAWVAETYAPVYIYDNEEHNIVLGTEDFQEFRDVIYFYQVSAVHCNTTQNIVETSLRNDVLLTVVATYPYDYIPIGTGNESDELDVLGHFGDTERVRICLERTVKDGTELEEFKDGFGKDSSIEYNIGFVQINRHNYFNTFQPDDFRWQNDTHFYVHVSEGKHATYISAEECLAHPRDITALVFYEDCADLLDSQNIIEPTLTDNLNVGEVGAQLIKGTDELTGDAIDMFTLNEPVWIDIEFCGGYPPEDLLDTSQTAEVRNLLNTSDTQFLTVLNTVLPFVDFQTGRISEVCGGSLQSKWWIPTEEN